MRSKITWYISVIITVLLFLGIGFWVYQAVFLSQNVEKKLVFVEIKSGVGTSEIAKLLKQKEIIKNPHLFLLYAGFRKSILKAGLYYLSPNQSIAKLVDILSEGKVSEKKITLIEGWRREQIAQYLDKKGIVGYKDFISASQDLEGKLFPDTYRIAIKASSQEIVEKLTRNFDQRINGLDVSQQDLILASIVEREAKNDEERAKIAGVYANRIRSGMALEADPTVQYGKDSLMAAKDKNYQYWSEITQKDYKTVQSRFNTYIYAGLPPAPICNPGLKSIRAAKNPDEHSFYYFFHLKDGTAVYSRTLAEHNIALTRYRDER